MICVVTVRTLTFPCCGGFLNLRELGHKMSFKNLCLMFGKVWESCIFSLKKTHVQYNLHFDSGTGKSCGGEIESAQKLKVTLYNRV